MLVFFYVIRNYSCSSTKTNATHLGRTSAKSNEAALFYLLSPSTPFPCECSLYTFINMSYDSILYMIAFLPVAAFVVLNVLFMATFVSMHLFAKNNNTTQPRTSREVDKPKDTNLSRHLTTTKKITEKSDKKNLIQKQQRRQQTKQEFPFHRLPEDVLTLLYNFLSPKSITIMSCVNHLHQNQLSTSNAIWQSLWFRDYGNILIEWKISRRALQDSYTLYWKHQQQNHSLEKKLSLSSLSTNNTTKHKENHDDTHKYNANTSNLPSARQITQQLQLVFHNYSQKQKYFMKNFYFEFQYSYMDYCLKGCNTPSQCYLGLHGHVVNFTDFAPHHPGLVHGIISQCGGDVTSIFEQIRHSTTVAKAIATKLCLFYDTACCSNSDTDSFGLQWMSSSSSSTSWSNSNSRPPKMNDLERTLFPEELVAKPRRPATLQSIRTRMDAESDRRRKSKTRVYYDPILRQWKRWYTEEKNEEWNTVLVD